MKGTRFTLWELVFVIAIFAILAGMLLPVLSKSREDPHRDVKRCRANLKQIGLGLLMYSGDYDGYFTVDTDNPSSNFASLDGMSLLVNGKVYTCPQSITPSTFASASNYAYIGSGLKDDNPNPTENSLAYDLFGNHPTDRWMTVLFIDGHVQSAVMGTEPWARNNTP